MYIVQCTMLAKMFANENDQKVCSTNYQEVENVCCKKYRKSYGTISCYNQQCMPSIVKDTGYFTVLYLTVQNKDTGYFTYCTVTRIPDISLTAQYKEC